jgi:RNA polymerase sigma-70 factor, ECF subfamily
MAFLSQITILLPELHAYARSVSDSSADAEDLVQDAIERTLRAPSHPTVLNDLRPWIFRVIRNLNHDELRKRRVRREYSNIHARLPIDLSQGGDHANDVLVRMTFRTLPAAMREVLFLVDVMNLKYAEAADVMGVPAGTVMSRISRSRRALIEAMRIDEAESNEDNKT